MSNPVVGDAEYTITNDDYGSNGYTSKHRNFDLRGSVPPGIDRDMFVEMIGDMPDLNHGAVENQQYLVSYTYYDKSNDVATIRIIKKGET